MIAVWIVKWEYLNCAFLRWIYNSEMKNLGSVWLFDPQQVNPQQSGLNDSLLESKSELIESRSQPEESASETRWGHSFVTLNWLTLNRVGVWA